MSHSNVAVFSHREDEVDELLEPYSENIDPESPFAVFQEDEGAPLNERTGKKGYWCNPNARWDWYRVGGRWSGQLKLKNNLHGNYGNSYSPEERKYLRADRCNSALAADCDFAPDAMAYQTALRYWECAVEGKPMTKEEKEHFVVLYKPEYFIQRYGTKEKYAQCRSAFSTYAFISADGEWHECGRMGWWGADDATEESIDAYTKEFNEYLEQAKKQGLLITIVDCHI